MNESLKIGIKRVKKLLWGDLIIILFFILTLLSGGNCYEKNNFSVFIFSRV